MGPSQRGITRPRLFDALRVNSKEPISLVIAPTGSGVTTVLRQWCEEEGEPLGLLFVDAHRLELDGGDADRTPPMLSRLFDLDASDGTAEATGIWPGIVIVDHVDVLTDAAIRPILDAVKARADLPNIVLAGTRIPSAFGTALGTAAPPRIGTSDLWFDRDELHRLAEEMGGVDVADDEIDRMRTITGGCPLAVTSLAFDIGWPHHPVPYETDRLGRPRCPNVLVPNVDGLLDAARDHAGHPNLARIIFEAAVFDWIDEERLAVLTDPSDGVTIERLRELPLPTVTDGGAGRWTLQPVFASRAEERLQARSPRDWADTVVAAARRYAIEGEFGRAIDGFVAAEAESELMALLVDRYFTLLASGQGPHLLEVLHGISHEVKLAEPMGVIFYGLLHRHVGDERGAQSVWAALYADRLGRGRTLHEVSSAVALVIALGIGFGRTADEVIGAFDSAMHRFAIRRDGTRPDPSFVTVDDAELLFELPWHLDPTTVLGFLHAARAEASLHLGRRDEALEMLAEGHRLANRDPRTRASLESVEAAIESRAGNLRRARRMALRALDALGRLAGVLPGIDPRLTLAEVALARSDVDQAVTLLGEAEADARSVAAVTRLAQIALIRAEAHLAAGEPRRGLQSLDRESEGVLRDPPPRLQARRHRVTVLLHLARGDLGRAQRLVERGDGPLTAEFDVLAAYAIATGDDRLLRMAIDGRSASPDLIDRVVWLAADAQLRFLSGDRTGAVDRLRGLVPVVVDEGLIQPILDLGIDLSGILEEADDDPDLRAMRRLLAERTVPLHRTWVRISEREQQVLEAIAGFVPDDELAERLGVSPNTVKSHRRSLFRKLKVSSQGEAVRRAEQLGLLAPRPSMLDRRRLREDG